MSKLVDHKLSGGKPETKEQQAYIKDLLPNNNRLIFLEEHNAYYYADISKAFLCHLDILEWCSFNDTGTLRLSSELESSKNFLLHGWQKKLESHLEKLSSNPLDTYKSLQVNILGENLKTDLCVSLNEGALEVKLRRTKRLRAPFIELLQTKYHQYLSRKAFDHDFLNT